MTQSEDQLGEVAFRPPRRSSTVPVMPRRASTSSVPSQDPKQEEVVETLYSHPSVKIIAFTTNERISVGRDADTRPGSLPPSSRLERTIAIGQFRIYKAPGSVAFLSCGSALQPILPKSQCWCLTEDNSRFVLQIRRPQYWRIELPAEEQDDIERAMLLREVLTQTLQFERTECPFQRSFTVELPDRPSTPVKLKAWTAEGKNLIASPFADRPAAAISPIAMAGLREATPNPRDGEHRRFQPLDPESNSSRRMRRRGSEDFSVGEIEQGTSQASLDQSSYVEQVVSNLEVNIAENPPQREARVQRANSLAHEFSPPAQRTGSNALSKSPEPRTPGKSRPGLDASPGGWFTSERSATVDAGQSTANFLNRAVHDLVEGFDTLYNNSRNLLDQQIRPRSQDSPSKSSSLAQQGQSDLEDGESPSELSDAFYTPNERGLDEAEFDAVAGETAWTSVQGAIASLAEGDLKTPTQHSTPADLKETMPATPPRSVERKQAGKGSDEPSSFEGSGYVAPVNLSKKRMSKKLAGRSYTAPPQLKVATSSSSKLKTAASSGTRASASTTATKESRETSPRGSTDSFHSVASWQSSDAPLPPSPPVSHGGSPDRQPFPHPHEDIVLDKLDIPPRDSSVSTVTPSAARFPPNPLRKAARSRSASPRARSPVESARAKSTSIEPEGHFSAAAINRRSQFRRRLRRNNLSFSRRALSPLPPAANLFTPNARRVLEDPLTTMKRLPGAILSKTFEILMSPPSHLIQLILRVARKILAGEWRGLVYGFNEGGEEIPVHWDYSDEDFANLEEEAEDDSNGLGTRGRSSSTHWDEDTSSRHWEVD
ncbi:inheritance of peroxisomes protein 1-domain-containing protein [Microdochium trichocladiopsis]|uniref:Inheritance of peroxisomes protein 1 n=1 Tax=Microdochium trichocladiopsis TaxID=1682393 RepID=A0A9P8XWK5_9PEZI|nr:inheritance of peroxisomes protein 1-domain-containing protein [Microdochium trichocladiopsis]KAH7018319.1 inheritance of peroxisomes protein 1-domain-containing protein [Microdochium trichocladiopsis]